MAESYLQGLTGGLLIGVASLLAMSASGKVPGISGIFGRLFKPKSGDSWWRICFLIGMVVAASIMYRVNDFAAIYRIPEGRNMGVFIAAGLLVGFGTRLGGGCTSGHGVCGTGMGARDSIVATAVFMVAGIATVWVFNIMGKSL